MKNLKFYLIIVGLLIGLTWTIIELIGTKKQNSDFKNAKNDVAEKINTEAKEIARKVDEKGLETVIFDITKNKVTEEQVKAAPGKKDIIDTTAMALDIRTKQLLEVKIINATLAAENLKLKKEIGENKRPFYTYRSPYLNLKFTPPNELDSLDQGTADVLANVKITDTKFWKRKWFLGAKNNYLAIRSDNPIFKINGADYLEFPESNSKFSLKGKATSIWSSQFGTGIGAGLSLQTGNLTLEGNYLWYQNQKKWIPGARIDLNIFSIGK